MALKTERAAGVWDVEHDELFIRVWSHEIIQVTFKRAWVPGEGVSYMIEKLIPVTEEGKARPRGWHIVDRTAGDKMVDADIVAGPFASYKLALPALKVMYSGKL